MSLLSIPSYKTDDPNYRYKMPRVQAKVEGRGNGTRTNIPNMSEIARALKRPPEYPTKFCGHELGAQSKFDAAEGKALINGAHEQQTLQQLIDKFIDKFVLCEKCSLPEIDLTIKRSRVGYRCNACGNQSEVDNVHKLSTYILRNPPDGADSTMGGKKNKKSKEDRQKDRAAKAKGSKSKEDLDGVNGDEDGEEDEEDEKKKKKSSKKLAKTGEEKKEKKDKGKSSNQKGEESGLSGHSGDESVDEDDDKDSKGKKLGIKKSPPSSPAEEEVIVKEDKKKKSKRDKESSSVLMKDDLTYDSVEMESVRQRLELLMADHLSEDPSSTKVTSDQLFEEVRLLQVSQDFSHRVKLYVVLEVLLKDKGLNAENLESNLNFLAKISEGMHGKDILISFEDYIHTKCPSSFKLYPYILQKMYDHDLLEEDSLLAHYKDKKLEKEGRPGYLQGKAAAQPFLTWLEENDSDSSSSEEEEDSAPQQNIKSLRKPIVENKMMDECNNESHDDDDEEIDIDAI